MVAQSPTRKTCSIVLQKTKAKTDGASRSYWIFLRPFFCSYTWEYIKPIFFKENLAKKREEFLPLRSKITLANEKERTKRKSKEEERRRRERKAMVALLVFILATLAWQKRSIWRNVFKNRLNLDKWSFLY